MFLCGKRGLTGLLVGMVVLWLTAGTAAAQDGAVTFLDDLNKEVAAKVTAPGLADSERQRNFRVILQRTFSLDEICQQVLGRYGRTATTEERQEFRQLFEDLLVQTWTRRFRDYTGHGVRFGDAVAIAGGDVVVQSEIEGANHQSVAVEWRLRVAGDSYQLLDIKAEGASMLLTYRSDYQSILRNDGMAGLNTLLRRKIGELGISG